MAEDTLHRTRPASADGEEPASRLVRQALDETRNLVRLEVALARDELRRELGHVKVGAVALAGAAFFAASAFTDAPRGGRARVRDVVAGGTRHRRGLGFSSAMALVRLGGWRKMPLRPMGGDLRRTPSSPT